MRFSFSVFLYGRRCDNSAIATVYRFFSSKTNFSDTDDLTYLILNLCPFLSVGVGGGTPIFLGGPNLRLTVHVLQTIYDRYATTLGLGTNRNHCMDYTTTCTTVQALISGADSVEHVPPCSVGRRTANKKLTKLY